METAMEQLKKILGEKAKENELLAKYTTFKIGGPADLFYEAKTTDELTQAITAARKLQVPVFILGGGSNILIGDKGIRGLVIKNMTGGITIRAMKGRIEAGIPIGTSYVEVDTGVPINKLVRFTVDAGLQGLEMHLGLPGSVGGALYMNSKWTHPTGYVGDAVYQATVIDHEGNTQTVDKNYFRFAYDYSTLQQSGDIVTSVTFALKQSDKDVLWEIANESISYRRETQPQGIQSAGCTFQNITKSAAISIPTPNHTTSAGFLVDHAGLKGHTIGKAQISTIHANFITNLGGATARDVVKLIDLAKAEVHHQFGVQLLEEIVRVGEF